MSSPCSLHIFHKSKDKADNIAKKILKSSKILENRYNGHRGPNHILPKINRGEIDKIDPIKTKRFTKKSKIFYHKTRWEFSRVLLWGNTLLFLTKNREVVIRQGLLD